MILNKKEQAFRNKWKINTLELNGKQFILEHANGKNRIYLPHFKQICHACGKKTECWVDEENYKTGFDYCIECILLSGENKLIHSVRDSLGNMIIDKNKGIDNYKVPINYKFKKIKKDMSETKVWWDNLDNVNANKVLDTLEIDINWCSFEHLEDHNKWKIHEYYYKACNKAKANKPDQVISESQWVRARDYQ